MYRGMNGIMTLMKAIVLCIVKLTTKLIGVIVVCTNKGHWFSKLLPTTTNFFS